MPLTPEIQYALSFPTPVEVDFLKPEQVKSIDAERAKAQTSEEFVASVINQDDFEERIQQAIVSGRIYSGSQMNVVRQRLAAMSETDGVKVDIQETLVSPTGQRVIMSNRLADLLGFLADGYLLKEDLAELAGALQADGVPGPEVDKVNSAMAKYGAVVLQKGVFLPLKNLLEEALGRSLSTFNPNAGYVAKPAAPAPAPAAVPPDQLPFSFIEYLKNTDKEFDRVEHEVVNDPMFLEFFAGLRKQYAYYKNLSPERMAGEMIVRPQLWVKLSPQTRAWVQNIVTRNRDEFTAKVAQVAAAARVERLDQLKKELGK